MKKIKSTILNACLYTVILLFVFFLFIAVSGSSNLALTFSSFISVFLIGCVISISKLIFGIQRLAYPLRVTIHFFALLGSVFALLFTTGYLNGKTPSSYIVIIFAYAIIYATVWVIGYFSKKLYRTLFLNAEKNTTNGADGEKKKKAEYKPLYK